MQCRNNTSISINYKKLKEGAVAKEETVPIKMFYEIINGVLQEYVKTVVLQQPQVDKGVVLC